MEDKNIIAARGLVKQFGKNTEHYFEPEHYNLGSKQIPYFINIEGNTVIRKNDYIKVGGMENDLYGHEELFCHTECMHFMIMEKNSLFMLRI